jgi:hypothetical protein
LQSRHGMTNAIVQSEFWWLNDGPASKLRHKCCSLVQYALVSQTIPERIDSQNSILSDSQNTRDTSDGYRFLAGARARFRVGSRCKVPRKGNRARVFRSIVAGKMSQSTIYEVRPKVHRCSFLLSIYLRRKEFHLGRVIIEER